MQTTAVLSVFKPNSLQELNTGNTEIDFIPALSLSGLEFLNVCWVVPDFSKEHVSLIYSFQSPFKVEMTRRIETSVTMYLMTKGRIAERNPPLHFSEKVNIHFLDFLLI